MSKENRHSSRDGTAACQQGLSEIRILVPDELSTAWQRCSWVLVQEKGQGRLESMEEMVRDFLKKHGC
ncbi:MAG: hypothetical protein HKN69_15630 [Desulfofustis sp.]|nr:hypothetical protein [Desulfofustis sp.]